MEEAEAVLARLERIDALLVAGAPAGDLLAELRSLVHEAEAWSAREGDARARSAVAGCRDALEREGVAAPPR